eukprot:TRINITY_DN7635_c0_g1_i1.p1 TRINITY_DN7635_c0_g1~~TRINITY_DN7635_c0_g1_i1.p1  ORF type:complete len:347 (+),score=13.57 TRINITY_DN7635_c0_g1_i1:176-1216(+)
MSPGIECSDPVTSIMNNSIESFLEATTPSVVVHFTSKFHQEAVSYGSYQNPDEFAVPFFALGDLWESFREWSAYGAGVPLVIGENKSVVQFYVPSLSALQLYGKGMKSSSRFLDSEPAYFEDRDSGSDHSDWEGERHFGKYNDLSLRGMSCSETSSDSGSSFCSRSCYGSGLHMETGEQARFDDMYQYIEEGRDSLRGNCCVELDREQLIVEFFEHEPPYLRVPLMEKILELECEHPEVRSFNSLDLHPMSWFSIAWYPIYRIPANGTLQELQASFLTYHRISSPRTGAEQFRLPPFGLASYRANEEFWGLHNDSHRTEALIPAAESWLKSINVYHPDFEFFSSRQ